MRMWPEGATKPVSDLHQQDTQAEETNDTRHGVGIWTSGYVVSLHQKNRHRRVIDYLRAIHKCS